MTVGERIKQKRIELNMSQDELAKKVGYKSRSSIQKIECARRLPLPKVEKMATALDCTPSFLMGWEEPNPEEHLINAYIKNAQDQEFLELYHQADPVIQQAVLNFLKNAPHDP